MLEDLRGTNENESTRPQGAGHSTGKKPYVQCIEHHFEPWIPKYSHLHRSLTFTFDLGEFVCRPPKTIAHIFD
jgi:hypothetical protein